MTLNTLAAETLKKTFNEILKGIENKNYTVLSEQQISLRDQTKTMFKNNDHELYAQYLIEMSLLLDKFGFAYLDAYAVLLDQKNDNMRKVFSAFLEHSNTSVILWCELYVKDLCEYAEEFDKSWAELQNFVIAVQENMRKVGVSSELPNLETISNNLAVALLATSDVDKQQALYLAAIAAMHLAQCIYSEDYVAYADLFNKYAQFMVRQTISDADLGSLIELLPFNLEHIKLFAKIKLKPALLKTSIVLSGSIIADNIMHKSLMSAEHLKFARLNIKSELKDKVLLDSDSLDLVLEDETLNLLEQLFEIKQACLVNDLDECFTLLSNFLPNSTGLKVLRQDLNIDSEDDMTINIVADISNPEWLRLLASLQLMEEHEGDNDPDDQRILLLTKQQSFKTQMLEKISQHYNIDIFDAKSIEDLPAQQYAFVQKICLESAYNSRNAVQFVNCLYGLNVKLNSVLDNLGLIVGINFIQSILSVEFSPRLLFAVKSFTTEQQVQSLMKEYVDVFVENNYRLSVEYRLCKDFNYKNSTVSVKATQKYQAEIQGFINNLYDVLDLEKPDAKHFEALFSFTKTVEWWSVEHNNPRKILQNISTFAQAKSYSYSLEGKIQNIDVRNLEHAPIYADLLNEILMVFEMARHRSKPAIIYAICFNLNYMHGYSGIELKLIDKIIQASLTNDESELLIASERLLAQALSKKIDATELRKFKTRVYAYLRDSYGLSVPNVKSKAESADPLDNLLAISYMAEVSVSEQENVEWQLAMRSLATKVLGFLQQPNGNLKHYGILLDINDDLRVLISYYLVKDQIHVAQENLLKYTLWYLLRKCENVDRLITLDLTKIYKDYAELIPNLDTTINSPEQQDFFIMGKQLEIILLDAFDRQDATAMAESSLAMVSKLHSYITRNKNYAFRMLAIALLAFEFRETKANDLLALLEADKLAQAAMYLVQHYDYETKWYFANAKQVFEKTKLSSWLNDIALKLGVDNETPCYDSHGYKLAIWKNNVIQALLAEDAARLAYWLKPQATFIIDSVVQNTDALANSEYEFKVEEIVKLSRSAFANYVDALHMDLADIVLKFNVNFNASRFSVANQIQIEDPVKFKAALYQELNIDLTLLSFTELEKFSYEKVKVYIEYVYQKANAGAESVDFTRYREYIPTLARLNNITTDLPKLKDGDSEQYKILYNAVQRIWWDHLVAHRFGIAGESEVNGLVYSYEGSLLFTMVAQLQHSFDNFVNSAGFTNAFDEVKTEVLNPLVGDNSISEEQWLQAHAHISANIQKIVSKPMTEVQCAEQYAKDKVLSLPVYTHQHLSGAVIFNHHQQDYCMLTNRGAITLLDDLDKLGITIYSISKPENIAYYAQHITAAIGGENLTANSFQALNTALGLKQCSFIAKKMQKSGSCGFSSCAKLVAQSIMLAEMYKLTCDFEIAITAAHQLYKAFTGFDRKHILEEYLLNAQKFAFEPNQELLARVQITCAHKEAYKPALLFLKQKPEVKISEDLICAAKEQQRQNIQEIILAMADLEEPSRVDLSEIRELSTQYADLNYLHVNAAKMHNKFAEITKQLRTKYGQKIRETGSKPTIL